MSEIILPFTKKEEPTKSFDSYEAHLADVMKRFKRSVEKISTDQEIDASEANMYAMQKVMFNLQVQVEMLVKTIGAMRGRR